MNTPETDAQLTSQTLPQAMGHVPAEFARSLERQRDEMLEALETLTLAHDMKEALGKEAPVYRALRESGWRQARAVIAKAKGGAA